jgi:hypothetical protein
MKGLISLWRRRGWGQRGTSRRDPFVSAMDEGADADNTAQPCITERGAAALASMDRVAQGGGAHDRRTLLRHGIGAWPLCLGMKSRRPEGLSSSSNERSRSAIRR